MDPVELFSSYTDEYGLVGNVNESGYDGGDCCHKTGLVYTGYKILNLEKDHNGHFISFGFIRALRQLTIRPGIMRRNPNPGPNCGAEDHDDFACWNKEEVFSRDQQTSITVAMTFYGAKKEIKDLLVQQLKRFGKYQNKDWLGPVGVGLYIRGLEAKYLYPVLFVTDAIGIIQQFVHIFNTYARPKYKSDHILETLVMLQARFYMPTPFSMINRKLFSLAKPAEAFREYFKPKLRGKRIIEDNPPIDSLYTLILERYL